MLTLCKCKMVLPMPKTSIAENECNHHCVADEGPLANWLIQLKSIVPSASI